MKNNLSIRKRDGSIVPFDIDKIANAIYRAMIAVNKGEKESSKNIAKKVFKKIEIIEKEKRKNVNIPYKNITVEEIQDIVEKELMANSFYDVAKSYIIYREKRAILRKRDIFKKRINLKPYEYPELYEYVNAIRHSYWIHTEFNYLSDIQDFKANITEKERSAIKKTMLAIAQIEVAVKSFWGDIYKKMPKPEIASVGFTFAESEVRHMDAYSHLLEILGLNEEFTKIEEVPVLMERIKYLENSIKTSKSEDNKEITKAILLFSLFIEHVSLFSQFLIIMSFNKYKNLFKGISNAVEATSKEEQIHGLFGIEIINIIKKEHPDWFDDNFKKTIIEACRNSLDTEKKVVDWIFEKGELEFLSKDIIMEFVKKSA